MIKQKGSSLEELKQIAISLARALSIAVEMHDPSSFGHQRRVAWLVQSIALRLGIADEEIEKLYLAALIHDVGKIGLPSEVLGKPSVLQRDEMEMIRMHPVLGYNLLKKAGLPPPIPEVVYQHHERLDGSGYPRGLSGDQILLGARILGVADVVEAISSNRPYRGALGVEVALYEINKFKGRLYDPEVVEACTDILSGQKQQEIWLDS